MHTWAILFGSLSAASWLLSAIITPTIVQSYWDAPPEKLVRRQKAGAVLNSLGALFAALAMALQTAEWASIPT